MRTVVTSLILAAGLAGAAQAQAQAPTAAPPQPPVATDQYTAPQPVAPPAAQPAEPPPVLPTSGDGAAILQALDKVCLPAVRGQGLEAAAKAAGLKKNRKDETWTMPLGGARDYAIIFQPQYSQKDVCQAEVRYALGQEKPIVTAINIWSFLQKPMLILGANYVAVDADGVKRVRKSWESQDQTHAVNFSTERKPDDTPLNARYDTGRLFYQERAAR